MKPLKRPAAMVIGTTLAKSQVLMRKLMTPTARALSISPWSPASSDSRNDPGPRVAIPTRATSDESPRYPRAAQLNQNRRQQTAPSQDRRVVHCAAANLDENAVPQAMGRH